MSAQKDPRRSRLSTALETPGVSSPDHFQVLTLGSILRRLRDASDLTREELAARAGISTSHLAHIEAGRRDPSLTVLRALSDELHVWPGLLLAAFLQTEMPDGHRPVFDAWVEELLAAMNGAQLELPMVEEVE